MNSVFPAGEHLRICPQDYTCCASETEERLSQQSQVELRGLVGEAAGFLLSTLGSRQRRFQGEGPRGRWRP